MDENFIEELLGKISQLESELTAKNSRINELENIINQEQHKEVDAVKPSIPVKSK